MYVPSSLCGSGDASSSKACMRAHTRYAAGSHHHLVVSLQRCRPPFRTSGVLWALSGPPAHVPTLAPLSAPPRWHLHAPSLQGHPHPDRHPHYDGHSDVGGGGPPQHHARVSVDTGRSSCEGEGEDRPTRLNAHDRTILNFAGSSAEACQFSSLKEMRSTFIKNVGL